VYNQQVLLLLGLRGALGEGLIRARKHLCVSQRKDAKHGAAIALVEEAHMMLYVHFGWCPRFLRRKWCDFFMHN